MSWQGELDLVPLPGEAGDSRSDAALDETADTMAPESKGKAPDADGATPAPHDGAAVDDSEPVNPPRCADAGGGRGSEWL